MKTRRTSLIALSLIVLSLWTVGPAAAAPIKVRSDRSDNTMYFTYNAATGEIVTASSSRILVRGDRVDHFAYVRERSEDIVGRRLQGRVEFRLNRDRAVRYTGRMTLIVENSAGVVAWKGVKNVDFVLRPRRGDRRHLLLWVFDLPAGNYTTYARFRAT
jgi:hypothetical protein